MHGLGHVVHQLFLASLALASQRSYKSGTKQFIEFCTTLYVPQPFPTLSSNGTGALPVCGMALHKEVGSKHSEKLLGGGATCSDRSRIWGPPNRRHAPTGICGKRTEAKVRSAFPDTIANHTGGTGRAEKALAGTPKLEGCSNVAGSSDLCFFGVLRTGSSRRLGI